MLSIHTFLKAFGNEKVLSIESLILPAGVYFIRGDNGSGKTTFFNCLAGISPCDGEIELDGISLMKKPIAYRSAVNLAEAEPRYPEFLTGRDLLNFVRRTKKATTEQVDYYVDQLGIGWYYHNACRTYSSGMLKKLSLALAFLGDPKLILLDEPLTTLDSSGRKRLFELIREKKETLVILSSHHSLESDLPNITGTFRIANKDLVRGSYP